MNYLHYGAPKFWYCIPPCANAKFEALLKLKLPEFFQVCPEFLRHKVLAPTDLLVETSAGRARYM